LSLLFDELRIEPASAATIAASWRSTSGCRRSSQTSWRGCRGDGERWEWAAEMAGEKIWPSRECGGGGRRRQRWRREQEGEDKETV
jgi:hypothetical protein